MLRDLRLRPVVSPYRHRIANTIESRWVIRDGGEWCGQVKWAAMIVTRSPRGNLERLDAQCPPV